jgi:uncharacterized phiE125 gp8 family phage protein
MRLYRTVAPAEGVISLPEARDHLRVSESTEDAVIQGMIDTATAYLDARDGILGEALVTQTWRLAMDLPDEVELPLGPVQSIAAIQYFDAAGETQTYSSANYRLVGKKVELVDGAVWPVVANRSEAFWIDFVAGYGTSGQVPATVRRTALMMVNELYDRRSMSEEQAAIGEPFKYLLAASRSERGLF